MTDKNGIELKTGMIVKIEGINMTKVLLANKIVLASSKLALESDIENGMEGVATLEECITEYEEQFKENSYNQNLRVWIGYMIENGNKAAVEIMKDIIRYNLSEKVGA